MLSPGTGSNKRIYDQRKPPMADKELNILLRFVTDARTEEELARASDNVIQHFQKVEEQIARVRREAGQLRQVAEGLTSISTKLLAIGTVTAGGIFAAAGSYVKDAKQATATTIAWKKAQDELNQAGARFGAVAATTALPVLQKAAELANKTAGFVEKHPDLVKAALNTGLVVASIGAIGTLASKGIKFYADLQLIGAFFAEKEAARQQQAAALIMLEASRNQLKAAGLGAEAAALKNAAPKAITAASIGGAITSPLGIAALATAWAALTLKVSDQFKQMDDAAKQLAKDGNPASIAIATLSKGFQGVAGIINPLVPAITTFREAWERDVPLIVKLFNRLTGAADSATQQTGTKGARTGAAPDTALRINTETMQAALQEYKQYKQDDIDLVREHYAERAGIVQDALSAELAENQKYAASVAKVTRNEASDLAKAATDFATANARAEQQYAIDRANIERDGAKEIEDIKKASQERLRKMEEEHSRRVEGLIATRDALGLSKENRDYKAQVNDEKRQTTQEVKDRRAAIAQRLADLKQSYEQERAQRLADYQARVAEIQASAAEQLKTLAEEHQAELQQIEQQKNEKLKLLDAQFNAERQRRYQYFLAQIRDLDAALLGETRLKQKYEIMMLQDLNNFLSQYRDSLSTGLAGAIPHNADGGYTSGLTWTGERGVEYIMTNRTVQAAESIIGGRLTQEGLLAAMSGRGGANVTLNNNARYSGEYTASMRRAVMNDMKTVVQKELKALIS